MICRQLLFQDLQRLRVGQPGGSEEACAPWIPADTLFSALCHAIRWVWGADYLQDFLQTLITAPTPKLLLTAAFPYVTVDSGTMGGSRWDFLPKPLRPAKAEADDLVRWGKTLKRTALIPAQAFVSWVCGQSVDLSLVAAGRERLDAAIQHETIARTALDRTSKGSNLFFVQALHFAPEAGLHALVKTTEELWELLIPALHWLEDHGIGGKRTLGYGQGQIAVLDPPPWFSSLPGYEHGPFCTLSGFSPTPEELPGLLDQARFQIVEKGGWSSSPEWSGQIRRYRLFTEGSCFLTGAVGRLLEVAPPSCPHPIYRFAYAFPVPYVGG